MTCFDPEILGRYFDGELPPAERADVERHVADCATCAAELEQLAALRTAISHTSPESDAAALEPIWSTVAAKLDESATPAPLPFAPPRRTSIRRWAAAASLALFLGLAGVAGVWITRTQPAQASVIDFSRLLDNVNADALAAFEGFLDHNHGVVIDPDAAHQAAPRLDFEVPATLPGGFTRHKVYRLRFGDADGIAATYESADGAFLATIFHPPVRKEQFGTHQDYPCVIGQHHGHAVQVGAWRMVHLTDPSTCHCVLARTTSDDAVAEILRAVAPRSVPGDGHHHD
ncbi:MAG TPA: zf-HC2 domain-containing protein [Phycisphaerae bacterium]|nr:zf-HC2 domain-containing protein [Phycisphaerales bacterium]HRX86657.1 zf-HC2 domain-containing protein [Phycisphaerae bacterium]